MFLRADHTGVSVRDIEAAIAFYRDVVGMQQGMDRELELGQITGIPGARARVVHMTLNESTVELFHYQPEGREPARQHMQNDFGLIHIGFRVANFWDTYRHLRERGVEFLGEPTEVRPGVTVAYFRGAEYEICEIREIVPPPA
jgi:catechol 2,3-dioxygenase-like lactoylglutathione lyase family enzyme